MTARRRAVSPLLLWCWVVLALPRVGLAAQDAPLAESPAALSGPTAGDAEEPAVEESWGRPERYRAPVGLRLLTGVASGLLTSVAGGAVLGLVGYGLCAVAGVNRDGFLGCAIPGYVGTLLGVVGGYGLGVWWGGELMGGDGRLLFSLLGAIAGGVVSAVLAGLTAVEGPAQAVFIALPIVVGSHMGYELSQRSAPSSARASRPGVQPLFGVSARGATLGLGGRF